MNNLKIVTIKVVAGILDDTNSIQLDFNDNSSLKYSFDSDPDFCAMQFHSIGFEIDRKIKELQNGN